MSEQNQKVETILDDPSLALKAQKQDGMEREPTLRPAVFENNPRFVVRTNVPNDKNHGQIVAATNGRAFNAVLVAIEELIRGGKADSIIMNNQGHRFVEKRRDPNPSIMSMTKVERLDNGVITISVTAGKNRPMIVFPFIDCAYHQFRGSDGQPLDIGRGSQIYAQAWVNEMRSLTAIVRANNYTVPAWRQRQQQNNQGGGGYGGGNNNRQGGNSYGGGGGQQNRGNYGGGNSQPSYGGNNGAPASGGNDFDFDADIPL